MKTALVFPGQGSQSVGMGKALADEYSVAREVFARVDAALSESLSRLMFEGPERELTLTANAQPALMAASIAALRVLETEAGFNVARRAAYVAGHSLGDYTALCAAGSLTLEDTARLLRLRGEAMQKAVPVGEGAMAAIIGLEFGAVVKIAAQAASDLYLTGAICHAAIDNGGGQVVVSGTAPAVERAYGARQACRREAGFDSACVRAFSLRTDEAGGARDGESAERRQNTPAQTAHLSLMSTPRRSLIRKRSDPASSRK